MTTIERHGSGRGWALPLFGGGLRNGTLGALRHPRRVLDTDARDPPSRVRGRLPLDRAAQRECSHENSGDG